MPIPDNGKKVKYIGEPKYWFANKRDSDWNVFSGDKGKMVKLPKLGYIEGKKYAFYPFKWKGFSFYVSETEITELIDSQLKLEI